MSIDSLSISKIAHLARIKIESSEKERIRHEINRILDWVEQLEEVNLDQVEPLYSVSLDEMRRFPDEVKDGGYASLIVANAPDAEFEMFSVPKVVE